MRTFERSELEFLRWCGTCDKLVMTKDKYHHAHTTSAVMKIVTNERGIQEIVVEPKESLDSFPKQE